MSKVLVVMSVYNEDLSELSESISSILYQKEVELDLLIVVDNPVIDAAVLTYIGNIKKENSNVIVEYNSYNIGLPRSLNKALSYLKENKRYKYLARMDADDISDPCRISSQIEYMRKNPSVSLVGCEAEIINCEGKLVGFYSVPETYNASYGSLSIHPTWLMKVELFISLCGYREFDCSQDYDFICRAIIKNFEVRNVPACLFKYRIRHKSIGSRKKLQQRKTKFYISKSFRRGDLYEVEVPFFTYGFNSLIFDKVEEIKKKNNIIGKLLSAISFYHWVSLYYWVMRRLVNSSHFRT